MNKINQFECLLGMSYILLKHKLNRIQQSDQQAMQQPDQQPVERPIQPSIQQVQEAVQQPIEVPTKKYQLYTNRIYRLSLKLPSDWVKNPEYIEKYQGKDGFFEIVDLKYPSENIDQVMYQEIKSPLKPYGANCQIRKLVVDGQPARLIFPLDEAGNKFGNELGLVVKYKSPIKVGNDFYQYVEVWADNDHMGEIINSFKLI